MENTVIVLYEKWENWIPFEMYFNRHFVKNGFEIKMVIHASHVLEIRTFDTWSDRMIET